MYVGSKNALKFPVLPPEFAMIWPGILSFVIGLLFTLIFLAVAACLGIVFSLDLVLMISIFGFISLFPAFKYGLRYYRKKEQEISRRLKPIIIEDKILHYQDKKNYFLIDIQNDVWTYGWYISRINNKNFYTAYMKIDIVEGELYIFANGIPNRGLGFEKTKNPRKREQIGQVRVDLEVLYRILNSCKDSKRMLSMNPIARKKVN